MFQQYKHVSQEYEKGELFKAMLLSRAQRLLVLTSTLLMSLSFVQYRVSDWTFSWTLIGQLLIIILPTLLIAVLIEIALILGAAIVRTQPKAVLGWVTLLSATVFSITGGELFFNKLAEHQPLEIHAAFALIGLIVPVLQITFELNKDNIKAFLKEGADISEVRNHILEKQTESMIVETRFDARSRSIEKQEVKQQIEAHSDRTVVNLVSNQEEQETIIAEVETITREDLLGHAVDVLRQELRILIPQQSGQTPVTKEDNIAVVREELPRTEQAVPNSGQDKSDSGYMSQIQDRTSDTEETSVQPRQLKIVPKQTVRDDRPKTDKALSKKDQIAAFLGTVDLGQKQYYWNHLKELADKFGTGAKTAQRAFEMHPEAKPRRSVQ